MSNNDFPFVLPPEQEGEDEDGIIFQVEDIKFELKNTTSISNWIECIINQEQCQLKSLSVIFCSDAFLHQINVDYLNHDTLTDIITFPYASPPSIQGEIYISIDRIRDNAQQLNVPFLNELHRVIIHGILHLCGYGDKIISEKNLMRKKEDEALFIYNNGKF